MLIASIGIFQNSFALETYRGYDFQTVQNPDGTVTWRGNLTPWVFDGNSFVPFVYDDQIKKVTTGYGDVKLNADGSYSFYKDGELKFTDKITAKYADISNLNSWTYPNTLNNDTPDISWNGTAFVSSKIKSGIGHLDYIFSNDEEKWKTQLEATNLSALTSKAFGFDQTVDLESDFIMFNGIQRNLDNFNNTTFDKQWLIDNKGKVIDFLNGVYFDFDLGFDNLYSITVIDTGANKSRLIFDYRTSSPLLPGQKLVIDPTFGWSAYSTAKTVFTDQAVAATCQAFTSESSIFPNTVGASASGDSGRCWLHVVEDDFSSITDPTSITSVKIRFDVTSDSGMVGCDFNALNANIGANTPAQLATMATTGTSLVSDSTSCGSNGTDVEVTLGSTANSLLLTEINSGDGIWGVGVVEQNYPTRQGTERTVAIGGYEWEVVYITGSPPNPVTVLNSANISTNTLDLIWSAPNDFGSGTFQTYTINYTTPWGEPVTFLANSTNLYYNVTGLTFGTDYSFRVAARTEIPGNNTGAYILNVTTTSNTYSLPPTNLVATSGLPTQIDLQWVASTIDNILGYKIERETPSGSGWATLVANTTNTNVYYNNTGLTPNIIYNYRVSAMNASGFSTVSNTYAMTTYHVPDAVTDLSGTSTDLSTIELSWTAPTSYAPAITGYIINGTTPTGEPVDVLNSNTGTTATTATALNLLIGQEYSFRVSAITVHGKNITGANIWNGSTIQTFVIGNLSNPDITNDDDFSIFFERTDVNASAIQLDVTYPNSYDLSCDFDYKYARTNQTYSSLTTVPDGADDQTATFTLINATGDLVQVRCWDTITGDESIYVITITDFPFLEQVNNLRNGEYGTFFQIGAFDGVMLIIIFLGMVGLNRTTPIVGVIFVVITVFTMQYFGLITYPVIMYPAMIMMIVWAFVSTRKDD